MVQLTPVQFELKEDIQIFSRKWYPPSFGVGVVVTVSTINREVAPCSTKSDVNVDDVISEETHIEFVDC